MIIMSDNELAVATELVYNRYKLIKYNNDVYYFNGEIYTLFENELYRAVAHGLASNPSGRFKKDLLLNVYHYLDEYTGNVDVGSYVAFNDCLYNTKTHECEPFNKDVVVTMKLKFNYPTDEASQPNMVDEIINKLLCGNKQDIDTLYEYLGYILARDMILEKMMTFNGDGNNGKSSVLELITYTFSGCCNQLPFKSYFEKFGLSSLGKSMFVYAHEMTNDFIKDATKFKEVLSNNDILIEEKYKNAYTLHNYNCKFIYGNNGLTKMDPDCLKAITRRLLPISFDYDLSKEKRDMYFYKKWLTKENAERLLFLAIEGLKRLQERGNFELSDRSEELLEQYANELDTVYNWSNQYEGDYIDQKVKQLFNNYRTYTQDQGGIPVKKSTFETRLCQIKELKISRKNLNDGTNTRHFVFVDKNMNTKSKQ